MVGLVVTSNIRNTFYEGDNTKWIHELYTLFKTKDDILHSFYLESVPETHKDALLRTT